jgi:hypothetical protein
MSGSRGPDGSYGKSYSWTLMVRARGNAPIGTQTIPITVRQQGAGEEHLYLKVRVLPGRSKQSGPRRDGEGTVTGGTGTTPPVTQNTSRTGLSARLDRGALKLVPGQMGESCTILIKGWRTGTDDQVEIFLPQESTPRGNLGNDLVAFPGSGKLDPANMGRNANGEYAYSINFRAMERAPGVTTMIEIVIRQEGHEPVRLLLRVAVDATRRNSGGVNRGTTTGNTGGNRTGGNRAGTGTTGSGHSGPGQKTVSEVDRERADGFWQQANDFAEAENWPQAIEHYKKALQLNPGLMDGWNALGNAYAHQEKWPDAEKAYREGVKREPDESYLHAQLGYALLKQGRKDEAMKEAQIAKRQGLQDHELFDELGLAASTAH